MSAVFEKQPEANVAGKEGVEYSGRREDQKDTQNQAQQSLVAYGAES